MIKFAYSEQDGCLSITDNGIGIKEEDFSKVFAFFKRIHGQNDYGGGTGAGMAIVKSICDNHNIPVSIQSELGKGTTFKLDLKNVLAK